jgi:DNA mismatch repair protein MutS
MNRLLGVSWIYWLRHIDVSTFRSFEIQQKTFLSSVTRWWQQYEILKQAYPEHIVLFQMGDFYEMFGKDAERASSLLDIALTQKVAGGYGKKTAMAGIPIHASEVYIARLIKHHCLVAVCDQVAAASPGRTKGGLLERRMTRLISPGTITEESLLEPQCHQYLAAVLLSPDGRGGGIAWVDVSTGAFHVSSTSMEHLKGDLARIMPKEILMESWLMEREDMKDVREHYFIMKRSMMMDPTCQIRAEQLRETYKDRNDVSFMEWMVCGALLEYCEHAQGGKKLWFDQPMKFIRDEVMMMDESTRKSLELLQSITKQERRGSLLHAMDRTMTNAGGRLLANRLRE